MILHLGEDYFVPMADLIWIGPYEKAMENRDTRAFLKSIKEVAVSKNNTPKSVVVTGGADGFTAYLSPISSVTLLKRGAANPFGEQYA